MGRGLLSEALRVPASQASIRSFRSPGHQRRVAAAQRTEKGWEESQDPPQSENDSARPLPPAPQGGWASQGRAPHLTPAPSGWRGRVAESVPRRAGGPSVTAASAAARRPSVDSRRSGRIPAHLPAAHPHPLAHRASALRTTPARSPPAPIPDPRSPTRARPAFRRPHAGPRDAAASSPGPSEYTPAQPGKGEPQTAAVVSLLDPCGSPPPPKKMSPKTALFVPKHLPSLAGSFCPALNCFCSIYRGLIKPN